MQLSSEDEWPALCGAGGAGGKEMCGGEAEMVEWRIRGRMFEGRLRWVREGKECARGRVVLASGLLYLVQFSFGGEGMRERTRCLGHICSLVLTLY